MKKNYLLMGAFAALMVSCSPNKKEENALPQNPRDGQTYSDGSSNWVWNAAMNYWMIRSISNSFAAPHYYYPQSREWSSGVQTPTGNYQPAPTRSTTPPATVPPATVRSSYKANSSIRKSGTNSTVGTRSGGFGTSGSSTRSTGS